MRLESLEVITRLWYRRTGVAYPSRDDGSAQEQ